MEELLELAKIQSPSFSLTKEWFDLAEFLRIQLLSFRPQFEEAKFNVNMELPDSPLFVLADPQNMERVVSNLLDNVFKHAKQGKYLGVKLKKIGNQVEIIIADKGDWIGKGKPEKNVQNFYQRTPDSSKGGLGLGLVIVRSLIQAHQGEIRIKSQEKKGTEVIIRLPIGEEKKCT